MRTHLIWSRTAASSVGRGNGVTVTTPVFDVAAGIYRALRKSGTQSAPQARQVVWHLLFFARNSDTEFIPAKETTWNPIL